MSVESEYWVKISDEPLCMKSGNNLEPWFPPVSVSYSLQRATALSSDLTGKFYKKKATFPQIFWKDRNKFPNKSTSKPIFQVDCHRKGRNCAQVSIQPVHLMLAVIRVWKLLQVFLKICTFSHCCDAPPKIFFINTNDHCLHKISKSLL